MMRHYVSQANAILSVLSRRFDTRALDCSHFLNYLLRSSRRLRGPGTVNPRVAHPSNDHSLPIQGVRRDILQG
jgi:hypothetical protein